MKVYFGKVIASPLGPLRLVASEDGLAAVLWKGDTPRRVPLGEAANAMDWSGITPDDRHPILLETERQLNEYFAGQRTRFVVKLDFAGTEFQRHVWRALLTIPYGEARSYRDIAEQIGAPKAVRAVGAANGRNPISIVVPCHRVVGAAGQLTGFAGGVATKAWLLSLESSVQAPLFPLDSSVRAPLFPLEC